jgi:hypothetical protein
MKPITKFFLITLTPLLFGACGGGSNNDQGVAFTLLGYNPVNDEGQCELELFITSASIPVSNGASGELIPVGEFVTCLTVQNNMSTQGVRADRLVMEYYIAGASNQPPTTSRAVGRVAGPAPRVQVSPVPGQINTQLPSNSSLPPGYGNNSNVVQTNFTVMPTEIREWLYLNRNSLPPLPFNMTMNGRVVGVTTSGDVVETNPLSFSITILEDNTIRGIPESTVDTEDGGAATFSNGEEINVGEVNQESGNSESSSEDLDVTL